MTELDNKYEKLTKRLIEKEITIATMESCTSGQVVSYLTNTGGSSAVVKGGFVTYCNEAKILAGVPEETIRQFGVYSAETAEQMAEAARQKLDTDIGVGITGTFANVDPNNSDSIPGKVYYAISYGEDIYTYELSLDTGLTRKLYKDIVADDVADELLKLTEMP